MQLAVYVGGKPVRDHVVSVAHLLAEVPTQKLVGSQVDGVNLRAYFIVGGR